MSGIMSGHVGAMKKKGGGLVTPIAGTYQKGGIWLPTAFLGKQYVISTKAFGETQKIWGSYGTSRNGATSTTNGKVNSDTLYSFGSANATGHPAAYFCRNLNGGSAGSYMDWYLPAKDELNHMYSAKTYIATNFASDAYANGGYYWSSTQSNGSKAWYQVFSDGSQTAATSLAAAGCELSVAIRSF